MTRNFSSVQNGRSRTISRTIAARNEDRPKARQRPCYAPANISRDPVRRFGDALPPKLVKNILRFKPDTKRGSATQRTSGSLKAGVHGGPARTATTSTTRSRLKRVSEGPSCAMATFGLAPSSRIQSVMSCGRISPMSSVQNVTHPLQTILSLDAWSGSKQLVAVTGATGGMNHREAAIHLPRVWALPDWRSHVRTVARRQGRR